MKVTKKKGRFAWVRTGGLVRQVNIQMVPRVRLGDYVIVHAGFAIQKIDETEALESLKVLREVAATVYGEESEN